MVPSGKAAAVSVAAGGYRPHVDTWSSRDLPVLHAVVAMADEGRPPLQSHEIAERTGLDQSTVITALFALAHEQPALFTFEDLSDMDGRDLAVLDPTGEARRRVGSWPTPQTLADAIVDALKQAAETEVDPVRKTGLRRTVDFFNGVGSGVLTGVATAAVAGQLGT